MRNQSITGRKRGSGYKNITRNTRSSRWQVSLSVAGEVHYGGWFADFEEAVAAAEALRRRLHECCPENSLPEQLAPTFQRCDCSFRARSIC